MIALATALDRVSPLSDESLRLAVTAAIFEGRALGGLGVREMQPEDIFVPLLASENPRRRAVLSGCRDIFAKFGATLSDLEAVASATLPDAVSHFAALLGEARPPELVRQVRSLLELVLDPAVEETIRDPIVGLAVDYAAIDSRPEYWQDLIRGTLIPGYAFEALFRIDPIHARLEGYLASLWIRALRGEISLRMPFVIHQWMRKQRNPESAVRRIVGEVLQEAPSLRDALRADCARYKHSESWVDFVLETHAEPRLRIIERSSGDPSIAANPNAEEAALIKFNLSPKPVFNVDRNFRQWLDLPGVRQEQSISNVRPYASQQLSITYLFEEHADRFISSALARFVTNLAAQIGTVKHVRDDELIA